MSKTSRKSKLLTAGTLALMQLFGGLFFSINSASAALSAVGPVLDPVNNGFPQFYSDENGLSLQLCLDQTPAGLCVLTPQFDPAVTPAFTPIGTVASGNFPDESFYFIADAIITPGVRLPGANTDIKITYRAALEQAFLSGIAPNTQNIFLRVQADLNGLQPNSTYTVDGPYGPFTVTTDATGGGRTRFEDLGGCALGLGCNFANPLATNPVLQAATTNVGSFLRWDPGVLPAAPAGFIGDPNVSHRVSGGRGGVNSVTVTGPNAGGLGIGSVSTDLFNVSGKLLVGLPNTVNVLPASVTVAPNGTLQLSATATDAAGNLDPTAVITWTSSDTAVGTVDANGLFTAGAANGTTTITAASVGKTSGTATINVAPLAVTTITLTPAAPGALNIGGTVKLKAETLDQNNAPIVAAVTWTSSNNAVATVGPEGTVTAVGAGTATITATSGAVTKTVNVTVNAAPGGGVQNPAGGVSQPSTAGNVAVQAPTRKGALVTWTTTAPTQTKLVFATKRPRLDLKNLKKKKPKKVRTVQEANATTTHDVLFTTLKKNTKYYFRVVTLNADGTQSFGPLQVFRTAK